MSEAQLTQRSNNNERKTQPFSASSVLDVLAEALTTIRREDRLTFADMAATLGKSEDQAAKYCAGSAAMDVITYARAKREWNGRFSGGLHRLCEEGRARDTSDRHKGTAVLKAALALSEALEDDDAIDKDEVRKNRAALEEARDAINSLLAKLQPVGVRA